MFQSHAGSIEARPRPPARVLRVAFQSHAGSIEAILGLARGADGEFSFNPTLVRLRLDVQTLWELRRLMFQSHAGSIEARNMAVEVMKDLRFQSHAGSIEALPHDPGMRVAAIVSIPRWFD